MHLIQILTEEKIFNYLKYVNKTFMNYKNKNAKQIL